jgi:endo-1,4-beta-xylanase
MVAISSLILAITSVAGVIAAPQPVPETVGDLPQLGDKLHSRSTPAGTGTNNGRRRRHERTLACT